MVNGGQAIAGADFEARGVVLEFAVVEPVAVEHALDDRRAADTGMAEVFLPDLENFNSGVQAGCAGGVELGQAHAEGQAAAILFVAEGESGLFDSAKIWSIWCPFSGIGSPC